MKEITLRIADIVVRLHSSYSLRQVSGQGPGEDTSFRYRGFSFSGRRKPDVDIRVFVVRKLPAVVGAQPVFLTRHFQDRHENWRLSRKKDAYIFRCPLPGKRQLMVINKAFDRVTAYVQARGDALSWSVEDIIYDFLQVFFIQYLSLRKKGIICHSMGIRQSDGTGLLFCGRSGAGKSTMARLWFRTQKAIVLNDDRVIVRKKAGRFFIFGSPWHGEFSDYLHARVDAASLKKMFFIYHSRRNRSEAIGAVSAARLIYPAIFAPFWDRECLDNAAGLAADLVRTVPCARLGFTKSPAAIDFIRKKQRKKDRENAGI